MTENIKPAAVLDRPEQIEAFALAVTVRALESELGSGLMLTRKMPTVKALNQRWGIDPPARTKKALLAALKIKLASLEERMGL